MSVQDRYKRIYEAMKPHRYYGDGGTIHNSTALDVEVDTAGVVVAVWFRCQLLPFNQRQVCEERAESMRDGMPLAEICGLELADP